jgi:hypothetical protein
MKKKAFFGNLKPLVMTIKINQNTNTKYLKFIEKNSNVNSIVKMKINKSKLNLLNNLVIINLIKYR